MCSKLELSLKTIRELENIKSDVNYYIKLRREQKLEKKQINTPNRLYFGNYCQKEKPVCLNETDKKCKSCKTPKCEKHLKSGICRTCSLKPKFSNKKGRIQE